MSQALIAHDRVPASFRNLPKGVVVRNAQGDLLERDCADFSVPEFAAVRRRCEQIDALLARINPTQFSSTRFLAATPAQQLQFTYEPQVEHRTVAEWLAHCRTVARIGSDDCFAPLQTLATWSGDDAETVRAHGVIERHQQLLWVTPAELPKLTVAQREYLARIHATAPLHVAIADLLQESSVEAIVHGDYRAPNILFRAGDATPRLHIIDWEYCGRGPRMYDWSTLAGDYLTLYLTHYVETRGVPEHLSWGDVEQVLRGHLRTARDIFRADIAAEHLRWVGVILLAKGCHVLAHYQFGAVLSELLFHMGRRFLLEWEQVAERLR